MNTGNNFRNYVLAIGIFGSCFTGCGGYDDIQDPTATLPTSLASRIQDPADPLPTSFNGATTLVRTAVNIDGNMIEAGQETIQTVTTAVDKTIRKIATEVASTVAAVDGQIIEAGQDVIHAVQEVNEHVNAVHRKWAIDRDLGNCPAESSIETSSLTEEEKDWCIRHYAKLNAGGYN